MSDRVDIDKARQAAAKYGMWVRIDKDEFGKILDYLEAAYAEIDKLTAERDDLHDTLVGLANGLTVIAAKESDARKGVT